MAESRSLSRDDERGEGGEIDLRALGRGIWRRKLWIIAPTLLVALGAAAFVTLSSPLYRSSALVLIENREGAAPRAGGDREVALPDEQAVASQVQLLQSRDLVRSVIKTQDLASDPEFAPSKGLLSGLTAAIGLDRPAETLPASERIVDKVAANLIAYPVQGSRVVGLEFVSTDADTSARIVNGFVDAYLDLQREAKRATNRQASQYLSEEITTLRGRVGEAEDRVETFRAKAGLLVGNNNTTVAAQQLGDITNQLSTSRTQQTEAQAKADNIRTVLRQGRPADALDVANSGVVSSLTQQRSQLAAQIASEGRTLLPQHPRMRELQAQLTGLDGQLRIEAEKIARAFDNDSRTAGARVASLTKQFEQLKGLAATANTQDIQLRAFERDARSQRDLLEQLLTRYREATARDNPEALLADARVISRGSAATEPYFPKTVPTILLAALGAFVLSLFAAAAVEVFGGERRSDDDAEAARAPASLGAAAAFGRLQGAIAPVPTAAPSSTPSSAPAPSPTPVAKPAPAAAAVPPQRSPLPVVSSPAIPNHSPASKPFASAFPKTDIAAVTAPQPAVLPVEPARTEAATTAVAVTEPARTEAGKTEPAKAEATDAKSAEAEPAQTEPAKAEPIRSETAPEPLVSSAPATPLDRPSARAAAIECADANLVAALARQLAALPAGDGALRILVTGATAQVRAATVAARLAATISESGRRLVALDAVSGGRDAQDNTPGLSELLSGDATFAQAIHRDRGSRVHIVPQGAQPFETLDPAARSRLGVVLQALALTYDFVMITASGSPEAVEPFAAHCGAAVLVSNTSVDDAATVAAHERLRATGIDDVVVLLVSDGGGSPDGRSLAA